MRYITYDAEQEAISAERTIFNFGAQLAQQANYIVDEEGIHGKRNDLNDDFNSLTSRWDVVRQTNLGFWIVAHPERHPVAANEDAYNQLMNILGDVRVEEYSDDWFDDYDEIIS